MYSPNSIFLYLKTGYLLHLVTLLETALILVICNSSLFSSSPFPIQLLLAIVMIAYPVFAQLDARSRFQDYKLLREQFYLHGFNKRVVRLFEHSRCQRDAVRMAASHFGYLNLCNAYFQERGYKWFHLLPDFVFNNPRYLLKKKFWLTTFFMKTYKCRFEVVNRESSIVRVHRQ